MTFTTGDRVRKPYRPSLLGRKDLINFLTFVRSFANVSVDSLVEYYSKIFFERVKARGELEACMRFKTYYGLALRHASHLEYSPIQFCKSDKKGFPMVLRPFRALLEGSWNEKRAALSVLQLFKLRTPKGPYTTKSITESYQGSSHLAWIDIFREEAQRMFPPEELSSRISKLEAKLHISGKNGPNGPAMVCTHIDRKAIIGTDLDRDIKMLASLTNNNQLNQIMRETDSISDYEVKHPKRTCSHSRLRIKYEAGGKARIFAILDIISQSSLKPIHDFFMSWLKSKPEDGTNDHSFAAHAVREWTKDRLRIWSFDLTTATDRYPVFLQDIVMEAAFGTEIKDLWHNIITNREFYVPEGTDMVKYNVGQPMGALSSWAVFAATHHVHVQTAARLAGHEGPFKDYRLIGDDISICRNAAVARWYIGMMRDLGVPFSTEKSVLPHQCNGHSAAELAKRVFVDGNEVTPVPPEAVIVYMRSPFGKRILIETGLNRGYSNFESPYSVQSILQGVEDYACMTLPLGRLSALSQGVVQYLTTWWEVRDEAPPMGLNPNWAYWENANWQIPSYGFKWILKSFLLKEINSAIEDGNRVRAELYDSVWNGTFSNQGGDWKPRIEDVGQTMSLIISYMSEGYGRALYDVADEVNFESLDLYRVLAKLHSYLKPSDLFRKLDFVDEKTLTRVNASKLAKTCLWISRKGINSFLEYTNN